MQKSVKYAYWWYNRTMGKPRFRPVDVMRNPRHFGRVSWPGPVATANMSNPERAWAWYQHRVALAVTSELAAREMTIEDFAHQLGEDSAWLTRKLHGQTPADLGEIFEWALRLGVQVLPEINDPRDLIGEPCDQLPAEKRIPIFRRGNFQGYKPLAEKGRVTELLKRGPSSDR